MNNAPKSVSEAEEHLKALAALLKKVDENPDGDLSAQQWGQFMQLAEDVRIYAGRQKQRRQAALAQFKGARR